MAKYELIFTYDEAQPRRVPVNGQEVIIGRSSKADIRIERDTVSRRHARVWVENGHLRVEDMGSRNGIHYKGERVTEADLKSGDRFGVGEITFTVADKLGATSSPEAQPLRESIPKSSFSMNELRDAFSAPRRAKTLAVRTPTAPAAAAAPQATAVATPPAAAPRLANGNRITREMGRRIAEKAIQFPARRVLVVAARPGGGEPRMVCLRCKELTTEGPSINRAIVEHVLETGLPMVKAGVSDTRSVQDSRRPLDRDAMCAPLVGRNGIYGVVYLDLPEKKGGFKDAELEQLRILATRAGISLDG